MELKFYLKILWRCIKKAKVFWLLYLCWCRLFLYNIQKRLEKKKTDFCKDCPEKFHWPNCDSNYCPYVYIDTEYSDDEDGEVFCSQCGLLVDECICLGDGGYDLERIEEE